MGRWILFILSEMIIFYVALIYHSPSLLFFVAAFLLLVSCLLLHNLSSFRQLTIALRANINIVEKGSRIPLEIRLLNHSILPIGQIYFVLRICYRINGKREKKVIQAVMPGRKGGRYSSDAERKIKISFSPKYTGFITISVKRARVFDLFGLLPLPIGKKHIYGEEKILILPEREEIFLEEPGRMAELQQEQGFLDQGEKEPPEIDQIREYRPGDALKNIHWKLTAKHDDLMICEHVSERNCRLVFFVDFAEQAEAFMRRFYSLSMELLEQDYSFYLAYYESNTMEIMRYQVLEEEDLYEYFLQMDVLLPTGGHADWEQEYCEKYRQRAGFMKLVLWRDLNYEILQG